MFKKVLIAAAVISASPVARANETDARSVLKAMIQTLGVHRKSTEYAGRNEMGTCKVHVNYLTQDAIDMNITQELLLSLFHGDFVPGVIRPSLERAEIEQNGALRLSGVRPGVSVFGTEDFLTVAPNADGTTLVKIEERPVALIGTSVNLDCSIVTQAKPQPIPQPPIPEPQQPTPPPVQPSPDVDAD